MLLQSRVRSTKFLLRKGDLKTEVLFMWNKNEPLSRRAIRSGQVVLGQLLLAQPTTADGRYRFRTSRTNVCCSLFEVVVRHQLRMTLFPERAKTVASRNEMIVEIISLFAFTFKIPFH